MEAFAAAGRGAGDHERRGRLRRNCRHRSGGGRGAGTVASGQASGGQRRRSWDGNGGVEAASFMEAWTWPQPQRLEQAAETKPGVKRKVT